MEVLKTTDKIFQKNTDSGDHGLPEVFAFKSIREHENSVDALCVNPKSEKEFATASHDQVIKLWDAPNFKCRSTLKGHTKGVWSLAYDNDGKRLLSCSPDATAKIWDIEEEEWNLPAHCKAWTVETSQAWVASCSGSRTVRATKGPWFADRIRPVPFIPTMETRKRRQSRLATQLSMSTREGGLLSILP